MSNTFWRELSRSAEWKAFWESEEVQRIHRYWTEEMKRAKDLREMGEAQGHVNCMELLRSLPERQADRE